MARQTRTTTAVGAGLAVALLALVGCGGDGGGGGGSAGGGGGGVSEDKKLAAEVPESIKSDGTITIGVDASYAPNEFLAEDGKTVIGFDVDLFDAVAKKLGLKTKWTPAPFDAIIPGVDSGKYEIGVSSFTINPERLNTANMVSYFSAGTQWASKKGNPSGVQPDTACGFKVAVQRGTVQALEDLPVRQDNCTDNNEPGIQVDQYQQQDQATAAVVSGKDDAMLADSPVVAYAVKKTGGQLEPMGSVYDAAPYGYVVPKEETKFAEALSHAVQALMDDGTYDKILKKWGVEHGAIEQSQVNP